ncbi:DegT/DnrJ/EryC1/StrS family aminotransferase [Pontibacter cellulosilyticus]|uniref:DegT/DnrJ/EryC1/StrS family aminotransferase n=1 Tax=Pontibacter cellulosilyticus TaxID=1720253 RepID=A0A923N4J2_9BACT|nr:DegT/DnrJ/EryC1/StrS family aminotransferase [Pontibacter cellulosilyticus]MBC5991602.1 DegT/DnrJ/EryC1/StrS family aminotransferase [Pontibacter cellulosilyticus]
MINVTKTFLPPIEEYQEYVSSIFQRAWLTNNGPLLNELELKLKAYLNVPHLLFLSNGTVAIQIAIKALELKGEIITTPFSYVATTSSIVWEQCKPIFVDIDPFTFNIDPYKIEAAITPSTTAILATHVFGNPCAIDEIQNVANKNGLKVIYDAAHCFGTIYKGKSIFTYGDISTTSFHATKLFHTSEGGAVFTMQPALLKKMALLRNFGHITPTSFDGVGINAKNSEFHAAMGLCVLKYADILRSRRKEQWNNYLNLLSGLKVQFLTITNGTEEYNGSYFPIVFETEEQLLKSVEALNLQYVYPRRYFYPSLNTLNYVASNECHESEKIAKTILCLPLFHDLSYVEQEMIARILLRVQNN